MPTVDEIEVYESLDIYGKTNTGKTVLGYSLVELANYNSEKVDAILFTNEAHWAKVLHENYPQYEKYFKPPFGRVYFHKTLEEFEGDVETFFKSYNAIVENPRTGARVYKLDGIRQRVNCIIIDDGEYIFREGYVKKFAQEKEAKGEKFRQPDWAIPRGQFVSKMKELLSLPSHFAICSKVGKEYEEVYRMSADGKNRWLTFESTGNDTYRLPEVFEYDTATRIHTYGQEIEMQIDDNITKTVPRFFGQVVKSKVTRVIIPPIPNPTIKKLIAMENSAATLEKQGKL